MKNKWILLWVAWLIPAIAFMTSAVAAEPVKVSNVDLIDLHKQACQLPYFGEKNLMIFYVDPDARKQNEAFTYELEESHRAESPNIYGFGVINAKDTGIPDGLIRVFARKRTAKNGALVLMDNNRILSREWNLGDCNNYFVILFINKQGELVFMSKGDLTEEQKAEFLKVIDEHK